MHAEITCSYIPLEIIWAAGLVPRRLLPPPARETGLLPGNFCSYARACLSSQEKAPVVYTACCDAMRRCYDVRRAAGDAVFILDLPRQADDAGVLRYRDELKRMGQWLQKITARPFSEEGLARAIQVYRRIRSGLARIRDISGVDGNFYRALTGIFAVPPEEALFFLDRMSVDATKNRRRREPPERIVLIAGTILPDPEIFSLFEEIGALLVYADFCLGERFFLAAASQVHLPASGEDKGCPFSGDPWLLLAREYLTKPPCPRVAGKSSRAHYLKDLLDLERPRGVIFYGLKFCDHGLYDVPLWRSLCEKRGIPFLHLEGEYRGGVPAQLRTRVQAFLETL